MPGTSLVDWADLTGVAGLYLAGHQGPEAISLISRRRQKCPCLVTRFLDPAACQEDLAIYRETGDQYREGIAFK